MAELDRVLLAARRQCTLPARLAAPLLLAGLALLGCGSEAEEPPASDPSHSTVTSTVLEQHTGPEASLHADSDSESDAGWDDEDAEVDGSNSTIASLEEVEEAPEPGRISYGVSPEGDTIPAQAGPPASREDRDGPAMDSSVPRTDPQDQATSAEADAHSDEPLTATLAAVLPRLQPRNVSRTTERNEANPRFSSDGRYVSFESRDGSAQSIFIAPLDGSEAPLRVTSMPPIETASAEDALLGVQARDDSFNTQLAFLPSGDEYIFTGNAGTGIYRLYRGKLAGEASRPITDDSREDGHPTVSPNGRWLVFVSARDGIGKLFLRNLETGTERQITNGPHVDLYPVWSPNSRSLAFTSGTNDNHDVFLIADALAPEPAITKLTLWNFDDLRPRFSPDGRWIAFYSNFSPAAEDKEWSILVIPADGSGPRKGRELAQRVVATNVVKDPEIGPAWLPTGEAIVYARNQKEQWNPIYVVDIEARRERHIETRTRMNHDLTCSKQGLLAFRAQVASWDDIFVAPLLRTP